MKMSFKVHNRLIFKFKFLKYDTTKCFEIYFSKGKGFYIYRNFSLNEI